MESKAKMSSSKDEIRKQLLGVKEAYETDYKTVEEQTEAGMHSLKSRIANFKLDLQEKAAPKGVTQVNPKYTQTEIADRAIDTYKKNINPVNPAFEEDTTQPNTYARRTNMRALAKSLAGQRVSGNAGKTTETTPNGNGDLGQYTSPAGPNGGDLGNNTAYGQYYALTTSMTLEQYEDHIKEKFGSDEDEVTPLVCGVCASDPCECNNELEEASDPVEELKERLLKLEDHSWQAIDVEMREIANEYGWTPKELHKAFKKQEGMIPDEWVKVNEEVQLCGFMPLDEAKSITETGMVYDVTLMWRGHTRRHKFFWPQFGPYPKEKCQADVEKLYPGGRLIAHYPSIDDSQNNMIVMIPPMKENFEFVPYDTWEELNEEADAFYNFICDEIGEPVTPMIYHDNGEYHMVIENHDTGEEELIVTEAGNLHAWFNKSKSKDGKAGWVQSDGSTCARKPGQKSAPKCYSSQRLAGLKRTPEGRKKIRSADARKKSQDKGQSSKSGAAKPTYVRTFKDNKDLKKHPSGDNYKDESYDPTLDEACWAGYTQKGMKTMFGKQYPNCVKKSKTKKEEFEFQEDMSGMSQKSGDKRSTESGAGMTAQGVAKYNRRTGGNLKTAVTTPPSKLKPGSKAANRRKSFCARSRGWTGERGKAARRRWNC